jgi:hypothetical protein|tara:strand:- start:429 stop:1031 length:603 start_codon:yes stop_codon:yes gene_type:complete
MRIIEAEQGTDEWLMARLGCPSGSGFSKLITAQGKESTSRATYVNALIAEKVIGEPPPVWENEWMIRGRELEPDARAFYEFERRCTVREVGFCKHDDYECGISPDGLVTDGGLEIKCPAPATHVKYFRAGKLPSEYKAQVQGCLWITKRKWWDFLSYHPSLPPMLIRVERDEDFIKELERIVIDVCKEIELETKNLEKYL